ncbi:hypothetical protein [Streptomyces chryseus]|uniref:Uncharacterized protein n=1 Tax=Streptomyces chryseus TaxID=68186 RepID=A0ABQ3DF40_9ACTN|nr:hypothetical protein [Streptomyces chryseus]GHA83099.1 hypothetical protein GCM10010346_01780 [Streptomyces chryseus]
MKPTPKPRPVPAVHLCWLCGLDRPGARDDLHFRPCWLCPSCWARQPSARNREIRSAEAAAAVLDVPFTWRSTFRWQWVQQTAEQARITAWEDHRTTVPGIPAPAPFAAFGWISAAAIEEAAAHLARLAEEFDRKRVTPR